jgi:hypothetical protein
MLPRDGRRGLKTAWVLSLERSEVMVCMAVVRTMAEEVSEACLAIISRSQG